MKILLLSRKKRLYSTRRIREEAEKLGHEIAVIDPLRAVLRVSTGQPRVLYGPKQIQGYDVVIPRVGTIGAAYTLAVIRQFETMRVPVVNGYEAVARARNKLDSLQILGAMGIRVPDTLISRHPRLAAKRIHLLGGTPVILKLLRGTQGTGVIFAETPAAAESVLETIWSLGEDIMVQRFIAESKGKDIRAMVIDGEVTSAMRRIARHGEFRSNIHRGATGEPVRLPKAYRDMAVRATEGLGLGLAGVDLLESKDGPQVVEVNASPGFQGLEEATKDNVARKIVEFAVRLARRSRRER